MPISVAGNRRASCDCNRRTTRRRSTIPAELRPAQVVAIIDSREQLPLDLAPLQTVPGTLTTGDYSVKGLESIVAIERKSLSDLLSCIGTSRERFDKEIHAIIGLPGARHRGRGDVGRT